MMLHIINQSPFDSHTLDDCLGVAKPNCSLLFIENGVYALLGLTDSQQQFIELYNIKLYFLKPDIEARGLQKNILSNTLTITDHEFVDLVIEHRSNQSWY